ncbi:phosphoadenosine phosphosulfate reductase [Oscillospiraceae bacterium OttesenSCG-928-F05]|nr:phosphoadenosine phosphosulfate reductase [Oscillospiraceae bacterium OttesenSCG-928-F05]
MSTNNIIASCSFGKDSLAAIAVRMEHGEPIDKAVYCRIMFDHVTSAELPEHEDWIFSHAIPLLERRYGIHTTVVQAERSYVDYFYSRFQKGRKAGRIYGFPFRCGAWCNDRLKVKPINKWQRQQGEYTAIIGIAADETKRIPGNTAPNKMLPLVDYGVTEAEAFDICRKHDLLSPAYNGERERLGCWFCHNQRIDELRRLRVEHPTLWRKLMALDADSPVKFTPRETLTDFDERFEREAA